MKDIVLWDVTQCGSCKNRRFGWTCRLHKQLLVTAYVVPSSPILVTLMMETILSSETSVITRDTRRHIPEDGIMRHSVLFGPYLASHFVQQQQTLCFECRQ
jgi:hypothetical protein